MKAVNVATLKNRLSFYLRQVKKGEEIIVRERDLPVARIVPLGARADDDDELAVLAARGIIRPGEGSFDDEEFWKLPAPRISAKILNQALDEERGGR